MKYGLITDVMYFRDKNEKIRFFPNATGLDFYMRATGYSIYPLEAFLITIQHWCQQRGVDPFTYGKET